MGLGYSARRGWRDKDEVNTEDKSDLEERFVSSTRNARVGESQRCPISQQASGVQSFRMLSRLAELALSLDGG